MGVPPIDPCPDEDIATVVDASVSCVSPGPPFEGLIKGNDPGHQRGQNETTVEPFRPYHDASGKQRRLWIADAFAFSMHYRSGCRCPRFHF
jgi:hypothetical protein